MVKQVVSRKRCLCTRAIMDLEGWIWSFFVNPFSFTVLCDDLGCFWLWCTGCVWSPLNRFCSWAFVLVMSSAEWFCSGDHHDRCFDGWTTVCFRSLLAKSQSNALMLNRPVLCVFWGLRCEGFSYPMCISKPFFCMFGRPLRFACHFLTQNNLWVWCSCLVGQSDVSQWRGSSISWTLIDTFGLIAALLPMVEAVSCTDVNPHADKLWGSEKTALCFCQGLIDWWSCTPPTWVTFIVREMWRCLILCMSCWRLSSCHFNSGCGGALLFVTRVRCLSKRSFGPRFHHY